MGVGPTRRELLRGAAVAPFILSIESCSRGPSWFATALLRIRESGRPGLVIRLPKDPALRCALGHRLARMRSSDVVICLETAEVDRLLYGAREGDDLLRIDADGNVLEGRPLDLAALPGSDPRPMLPFGVSIGPAAGCAETVPCLYDPCASCGMAAVTPSAREFVKFLAK